MTITIARSTIWFNLRQKISIGDVFETWSVTGRARGIRFSIEQMDEKEILIRRHNDKRTYQIFRQSAEGMAEIWENYLIGNFPRKDMGKITFASSYLLGIFAKLTGRAPSQLTP